MEKQINKISKDAKKTILLIDDELENHKSLGELLVRSGYDVLSANDGKTGLEMYRKFKPDLVLTDYRMPGMDGLDLLKKIRNEDESTPVLMLTAYGAVETYLKSLSLGVYEYINKPINPKELIRILENVFKRTVEAEEARLKNQNKYLHEVIQTLWADLARCKENKAPEMVLDRYRTMMAATGHSLKSEFMHIGSSIKALREIAGNSADVIEEYEMMERSIQFSQLLLRRLLDFIEMGKPNIEYVEVVKLIQKTISLIKTRLSSNINLEVNIEDDAGEHVVRANTEQLMVVLIELIQNAINVLRKKGGLIELKLERRNKEIALSVIDNGPGIPSELRKELFVKEVKSKHGLGMGLYLSSKIIDASGGKLMVENTSKNGSVITILMPAVIDKKE